MGRVESLPVLIFAALRAANGKFSVYESPGLPRPDGGLLLPRGNDDS